jgi:DNA-binding LytR/AlgR family response regulator
MKILICNDDATYVAKCKEGLLFLAQKYGLDVTVLTAKSGNNLLFYIDTKYRDVDLIYMDYDMPGLSGVKTAQKLRESGVIADIVFCTNGETLAVDGYQVGVLDYLAKEMLTTEKFEEIFLKAVVHYKKRLNETITFSCRGDKRVIAIKDILYFEVQQQIVTVHYYYRDKIVSFGFYSTLSEIEKFFADKGFIRNHKSYLVSKDHIVKKTYKQIEMENGDLIPIGRKYQENCRIS